jgi:hypothetical protein
MDSPAFEPLEWDDQEEATIPSRARAAVKKSSRRGWLVITNEHPVTTSPACEVPQRDTYVSADGSTERDTQQRWQPTTPCEAPIPLISRSAPALFFQPPPAALTPPALTPPPSASMALHAAPAAQPPWASAAGVELTQLRRWLIVSLALSAIAAVLAATAVVVAVSGAPTAPASHRPTSLQAAASQGLRTQLADATIGAAPAPPRQVKLTMTLLDSYANVTLTREGEKGQILSGPWPLTLQLEPGRYTVTALGPDFTYFQRQLDLALDRPEREVVIRLQ